MIIKNFWFNKCTNHLDSKVLIIDVKKESLYVLVGTRIKCVQYMKSSTDMYRTCGEV